MGLLQASIERMTIKDCLSAFDDMYSIYEFEWENYENYATKYFIVERRYFWCKMMRDFFEYKLPENENPDYSIDIRAHIEKWEKRVDIWFQRYLRIQYQQYF